MGYTAPCALGKSPRTTTSSGLFMRLILLILLVALLGGGAWYLSTLPTEVPTRTIETDASAPGNAS
jgi:hypothetical protein